jgi:Glycosyltransferase family 87
MHGSLLNCAARPVFGWRGGVETRRGRLDLMHWSMVALVIGLVIWGLTDVRRRGRADPQHPEGHKTDFTVYTIAGETMYYGGNPYTVANLRGWKYVYPPLFALLVAPLSDFDSQTQVMVWFAVSLLLGWGCLRECVRIARVALPDEPRRGPFGPIPTWVGAAAVTAAAVPALNCLQRGQMGVAVLYFLLLGFRLLVECQSMGRAFMAGVVLALPIVLKATPLLPVAFVLVQQAAAAWFSAGPKSRWIRPGFSLAGAAFGLIAFLLFVPAALIGWQANLQHLGTWWNTVARQEEGALKQDYAGDNSTEKNQSLTNAVHRFGNWAAGDPQPISGTWPAVLPVTGADWPMDGPLVTALLLAVRGGVGCLLLAVGYRTARAGDTLGLAVGFSLAYLATLIVCQIARGHYFVIWLPTVMFTSVWLVRQNRPRSAAWHAIIPAVLVITHYVFLGSAGSIGLLGLGTAAWYMSACVTVLRTNPVVALVPASASPTFSARRAA